MDARITMLAVAVFVGAMLAGNYPPDVQAAPLPTVTNPDEITYPT